MRGSRLLGLAGVAFLSLVACSEGGDQLLGSAGGDLDSIEGSLALLPDDGEDATVVWGDVERAAELAGVDRPDDPAEAEAVREYLGAITGFSQDDEGNPVVLLPPEAAHVERPGLDEFAADVGWHFLQVDRFVERATPPQRVTVLQGDFDGGAIDDALGEPDDGLWVAGRPDGSQDLADTTPARPLGETLWLALDDDVLTVTSAEGPDGEGATFADDPAMQALGTALDDAGAYAAMLVRPGLTDAAGEARQASPGDEIDELCANALAEPTLATGTGLADDDGPVILVALAHDSADAATANAEALEHIVEDGSTIATGQPWSELVSLDAIDVDGETVIARLRPPPDEPARSGLWHRMMATRDGLVTSC